MITLTSLRAACLLAGLTLTFGGCGSEPEREPSSSSGATETVGVARAPIIRADGLLPGMARFRSGPKVAASPICANPQAAYFGGPLLQSPTIVAVFWTNTVNAAIQANIGQFYADVTQSSFWTALYEYDSIGKIPGSNQAILPGTLGGSFTIAPLKCAPGGSNCKLTDDDLQAELARQINLGVLPAPTLDCTGNVSTLYMVDLPPNISLSGPQGSGKSCVNNGFCAYHGTGTFGPSNLPLVYGALMDVFTGPCSIGCANNATSLENATEVHSHELVEAVTDPDIGLDVQAVYTAPAAWGDNNNQCGEVADICDDGSPGDAITVSGRTWVVQQFWSNQQGKCVSSAPLQTICSGTTSTNCRKCSCGDNGGACNGGTSVCETDSGNVLFGACQQCTAAAPTCAVGTCQQSATPTADDICMNCVPVTTCPSSAECGLAPDGCGGVLICGTCSGSGVCRGNRCVVETPDAGADSGMITASGGGGSGGTSASTTTTTSGAGGLGGASPNTGGAGGATATAATSGIGGFGGTATTANSTIASSSQSTATASSSQSTATASSSQSTATASSSQSGTSVAASGSAAGGAASTSGITTTSSAVGGGVPLNGEVADDASDHEGGCGCRVAGEPDETSHSSLAALSALLLAAAFAERKRRAATEPIKRSPANAVRRARAHRSEAPPHDGRSESRMKILASIRRD